MGNHREYGQQVGQQSLAIRKLSIEQLHTEFLRAGADKHHNPHGPHPRRPIFAAQLFFFLNQMINDQR